MVSRRGRSRVAHVLTVGSRGGGSCSRWVAWCVCAAGSPGSDVGSGRVVGSSTGLLDPRRGVRCLRGVVPGHRVRPWCPRRVNVISSHLPWRNRPVRSCSWRRPPPRARGPGSTHRGVPYPDPVSQRRAAACPDDGTARTRMTSRKRLHHEWQTT